MFSEPPPPPVPEPPLPTVPDLPKVMEEHKETPVPKPKPQPEKTFLEAFIAPTVRERVPVVSYYV